jgi:hypothetical protein
MLPHERELVKLLQNEPFALLGINSDEAEEGETAAQTVKEILERNQITWRQSIQGSTGGPLAREWNVQSWPTIYVLDHKGVIRFKNVRDREMTDAVEKLLAEVKPTAK